MNFFRDFLQRAFRKVHGYFLPTRHNAYRPRLLTTSWLLFFLALILTTEGLVLANVYAGQSARDYLAAVLPAEVVRMTNIERGYNNVATLKENAALTKAAEAKARDMAKKSYFAHVGPGGKEPWAWIREAGYSYQSAGENLAVRFNESADVVRAWMASQSHRANIVKKNYTEIGVGVAEGIYKDAPATFVVQYFGRPSTTGATASETVSAPLAVELQTRQVLGAAAEATAKADIAETVAAVGTTPTTQAFGVLAGAAVLLLALVFLTFAVNIQVQPVDLLLGGAGVAAVAVAFLVANVSYVIPVHSLQTASVFEASGGGILLTDEGATTLPKDEGIVPLPEGMEESTLNP